MRTRHTRRPATTRDDDNDDNNSNEDERAPVAPSDELGAKIASIEQEVNRRFEEIDHDLESLKANFEKTRAHECEDDERFLKLCHAVDYVLERMDYNYDTLACREMVLSLLGQKSGRPFSGRTIRNRQLRRRMKRWCLCIVLILFLTAGMSLYGLHRSWYYLLVVICITGAILSSIGIRRIYRIIEAVW